MLFVKCVGFFFFLACRDPIYTQNYVIALLFWHIIRSHYHIKVVFFFLPCARESVCMTICCNLKVSISHDALPQEADT